MGIWKQRFSIILQMTLDPSYTIKSEVDKTTTTVVKEEETIESGETVMKKNSSQRWGPKRAEDNLGCLRNS